MTKQYLYTDQAGINSNITTVQSVINVITPYVERYNTLNLPPLTSENLQEFIKKPKTFFVKILSDGETLKVGQMELEPQKVYELFPVPEEIRNLVNDLMSFSRESNFASYYNYPLQYVEVVENELIVSPEYVNNITEKFTFYTESEEQNQALTILKRISEDLNTLKSLGKKPYHYNKKLMETCFKEKQTEAGLIVSENIKVVRNF